MDGLNQKMALIEHIAHTSACMHALTTVACTPLNLDIPILAVKLSPAVAHQPIILPPQQGWCPNSTAPPADAHTHQHVFVADCDIMLAGLWACCKCAMLAAPRTAWSNSRALTVHVGIAARTLRCTHPPYSSIVAEAVGACRQGCVHSRKQQGVLVCSAVCKP